MNVDHIAAQLEHQGYSITPDFLTPQTVASLRADLLSARATGQMKRAGVSSSAEVNAGIRRDEILWLERPENAEAQANPARAALFDVVSKLQLELNRSLFLNLHSFEGHYAHYPVGGFYQRHLDRFRDKDGRIISLILYLNDNWQTCDGGQLRLYVNKKFQQEPLEIRPNGGTLVVFLSGEIEHEVAQSFAPRLSFTGWFKSRGP